jgi:hypothetical protein
MDNIAVLFAFLEPRLVPLLTAFAAGVIVGVIYIRKLLYTNKVIIYHTSVITAAFFISLATIRFIENGDEGFEHWLFIFLMYIFYTLGMVIGKRF